MSYTIRADEKISYTLCENDTVAAVLQNCHLILTTRKGSIPMYREFGLDMSFIDRPQSVAQVMIASRVKSALEDFEPRAGFVNLFFEQNENTPGEIIPVLEVEINE